LNIRYIPHHTDNADAVMARAVFPVIITRTKALCRLHHHFHFFGE